MLVAAIVTFLVIPVLAGRRSYSLESAHSDPADASLEGLDFLSPASEGAAD
jgi:hypothetical protein